MTSSTLLCSKCRVPNRATAKFCMACGTPLLAASRLLKQRYRILTTVGQGGFGTIYQAEDTHFPNLPKRAVKEMHLQSSDPQEQQQAIDAFQHEALLLAGLMHQNLPRIYEYFEERGRWYLVMDYVNGQTLEDYVQASSGGTLPLQEVFQVALQLCTVLDYLHNQQPPIIFRDLKPDNVMITADQHLYLIDFGIARFFKPGQARDTIALGSPGYAAPEQYGKAQTTARADIYSLGATLHYLLSGRDPSEKPFQFPPLDLSQYAPAGPALAALVLQMVEIDEAKRPASVRQVKQELQRLSQLPLTGTIKQPAASSTSTTNRAASGSATTTQQWQKVEAYFNKGELVNVQATAYNRGGLVVDVEGLRGFVPRSHLLEKVSGKITDKDLQIRVGVVHQLKIIEIDRTADRLILSERLAASPTPPTPSPSKAAPGDVYTLVSQPAKPTRPPSSSQTSTSISPWRINLSLITEFFHPSKGRSRDEITALAWSPNGRSLASSIFLSGMTVLWDALTGRQQVSLPDCCWGLAWSGDGRRVFTIGTGTIRVWDVSTGKELRTLQGLRDEQLYPRHIAVFPDETRVAVVIEHRENGNGQIRILDATSGQLLLTYFGHKTDYLYSIAYIPGSSALVSAGGKDETAQIWDGLTGKTILTYRAHSSRVTKAAPSPDGGRIASITYGSMHVWDAATGKTLVTVKESGMESDDLAWSPDGKYIATSYHGWDLHIWDAATGRRCLFDKWQRSNHLNNIKRITWSPDGRYIALGCEKGNVEVWKIEGLP